MTTQEEPTVSETGKRSSGLLLWIILGALAVVLAGAAATFFLVRGSETSNMDKGRTAVEEGDWAMAAAAFDAALVTQPSFLRQHVVEALAQRGLSFYELGDYETALAEFNAALNLNPELVDLLVYRADVEYRKGDDESAMADLKAAMAGETLLPEHLLALAHARQALIYQDQSGEKAALDEARAALELAQYLDEPTVAQLVAIRALGAFDPADAEASLGDNFAALEMASHLSPETRALLLADQVAAYDQAGLYEQALEIGDAALALGTLPAEAEAALRAQRAAALYHQGDLEQAIGEAQAAADGGEGEALLHALLAVEYYLAGDEEQALSESESALELDDDNALAYRVRGTVLAWQGLIDDAITDLERAVELDPAEVEALAMLVYAHLELNDLGAAEDVLKKAQEADPAVPATLWAEAQLAFYNNDFATARALLDLAIDKDDSRPEYYALRTWTYRTTVEEELSIADTEQALAINEDFPLALANHLAWQMNLNELDGFEENAERLSTTFPDNYRAYTHLGYYQLFQLNDPEAALATAEKILSLRPESTVGYLLRGSVHQYNEEYDLAQDDFEEALARYPNSLETHDSLHWLYRDQEEYDQALAELDVILAMLPDDRRAMMSQAWIYNLQGDRQGAWDKINQVLTADPDYQDALITQAEMYGVAGEIEPALDNLQRILDREPSNSGALLEQAYIYSIDEDNDGMVTSAEQALEADPGAVRAYGFLGWGAMMEDDFEQALEYAEAWVEAEPEWAPAQHTLANVYMQLGDGEPAAEALNQALSLTDENDPSLANIYYDRHLVYLNLGKPELARADLETILATSENLDLIDSAEIALVNPGVLARTEAGRVVLEDEANGFAISYDETWQQWAAEPESGYMLSLGYGDEMLDASVDLWILDDWDPSDSVYDLAAVICETSEGCDVQSLEAIQVDGRSSLVQYYSYDDFGLQILGRQYIVPNGNQIAILDLWALEDAYLDYEEEFDAIADSFTFLE